MTDKVVSLRPALSESQREMLDRLEQFVKDIEAGILVAFAGVAVYEDQDGDETVVGFEEGVSTVDCEIAGGLRAVAAEYEEQWAAERFRMIDDIEN